MLMDVNENKDLTGGRAVEFNLSALFVFVLNRSIINHGPAKVPHIKTLVLGVVPPPWTDAETEANTSRLVARDGAPPPYS